MYKKIYLAIIAIVFSLSANSQNGELPPVYFTPGANVCDYSPWKLVFQDYFDGNKLMPPWITFNSWSGMPGGDNDNWEQGRIVEPFLCIMKDENVEVSNGTVKLKVIREAATWHCNSCTMPTRTTNYTSGNIRLPYTKGFNAGKFEARIKMPTFLQAHSTFWLWRGSLINEIDIAEAYGWTGNSGLFGHFPRCNNSLHAWSPSDALPSQPNPYNMVHDEIRNHYARQTWWDWQAGRYFDQHNFHTYTLEWDTAIIRIYLDGNLESEQWKYYQWRSEKRGWWPFRHWVSYKVGSGCNPDPGTWKILRGFPYNNQSNSALNFTTGVDKSDSKHPNGYLGAMEIDYVKIWEKYLENGWTDLCDPGANTTISGPDVICNTGIYTANPVSPGGHWFVSNSNLTVLASNNATATIQKNSNATNFAGYIYYSPIDSTCPNPNGHLTLKRVDVGFPSQTQVVCAETHSSVFHILHYNLHANPNIYPTPIPYFSPTIFEWFVDYGLNYSQSYHAFGQFISTPTISYTSGSTNPVRWTLKITNACGTVTKTGQMNYYLMKRVPGEQTDKDSNNIYAVADITDVDAYNRVVEQRMSQTFIDMDADETERNEVFEKIQMEELAPYIIIDSSIVQKMNSSRKLNNIQVHNKETIVYPNPTSHNVNIELSEAFVSDDNVELTLHDMFGALKKQELKQYTKGDILNIEISNLPIGVYNLTLRQQSVTEHFKIQKR
jgi:hypothetical protein